MCFNSVRLAALGALLAASTAAAQARQGDEAPPSAMSAEHIREITLYHNKVRREVGVAPLKWSRSLAAFSQQWSDRLAKTSCQMKHRSGHRYGENLFIGTHGRFRALDAAKAWESEKPLYDGGVLTRSNWKPAGHYTQMVWRSTRRLGCGESMCKGMLIVVCNYDPPGNYIGQRPY
jgi:pathogenesis-related protein 1